MSPLNIFLDKDSFIRGYSIMNILIVNNLNKEKKFYFSDSWVNRNSTYEHVYIN